MAKVTKTQARRLMKSIVSKSKKLWTSGSAYTTFESYLATKDFIAIEKIMSRSLKRLK